MGSCYLLHERDGGLKNEVSAGYITITSRVTQHERFKVIVIPASLALSEPYFC
jgi:hypothetical protein